LLQLFLCDVQPTVDFMRESVNTICPLT
jgi:hypothetical protein